MSISLSSRVRRWGAQLLQVPQDEDSGTAVSLWIPSFFFFKLYPYILIMHTNGFHDGILYTYIMDFEPVFSLLFPSLPVDLLPFPNCAPSYFHVFLTQLI